MFDVSNSRKIILKTIFFNILLLMLQLALVIPMYFKIKIDFKYTYYGTILLFGIFCLSVIYLLIYLIKCALNKKIMVSILLFFYVLIFGLVYIGVVFLGFLPISGITLDGK
jgi:hypothetical protein